MVFEQDVQIQAADGLADAAVIALGPAKTGRWPGVIMLTDTFGLRESHRQVARRLSQAGTGYTVVLPNLFYRSGRPPFFPPPIAFSAPETQARAAELRATLTPDVVARDAAAYVDYVTRQLDLVAPGPIAVVGYCFSGAIAVRMAATRPEAIGMAASFHGGRLATDDASSPHLLLPQIQAQLYFGHARNDRSMPAEAIDTLEQALAVRDGRYGSEVYEAGHGWTVPDHPAYNEAEAERAFEKLVDLLAHTLVQRLGAS
jgi:carboxymethylenebutenolidase